MKAKQEREQKEQEAQRQEELRLQKIKAEKEEAEKIKTQKRLRRTYGILAFAFIALIAAGYFAVTASIARTVADSATIEANKQRDAAKQALQRIVEFEKRSWKEISGGIIFYSDSTREHGLVAAEKRFAGKVHMG